MRVFNKMFVGLVAALAVLLGTTAYANHFAVNRVVVSSGYSFAFPAFSYQAVAVPVAPACAVAIPTIAAPIAYSAPACEQVVQQVAVPQVAVQQVCVAPTFVAPAYVNTVVAAPYVNTFVAAPYVSSYGFNNVVVANRFVRNNVVIANRFARNNVVVAVNRGVRNNVVVVNNRVARRNAVVVRNRVGVFGGSRTVVRTRGR